MPPLPDFYTIMEFLPLIVLVVGWVIVSRLEQPRFDDDEE